MTDTDNGAAELRQPWTVDTDDNGQDYIRFFNGRDPITDPHAVVSFLYRQINESNRKLIADIRQWVKYNKHDLGEMGEFIRTQYVYNKLDMLEEACKPAALGSGREMGETG